MTWLWCLRFCSSCLPFFSLEAIHVVWSCSGIFCQSTVALCTWTHAGSNCWIKHRLTFWPWESQWISVDHQHLQLVSIVMWVSILMWDSTKKRWWHGLAVAYSQSSWLSFQFRPSWCGTSGQTMCNMGYGTHDVNEDIFRFHRIRCSGCNQPFQSTGFLFYNSTVVLQRLSFALNRRNSFCPFLRAKDCRVINQDCCGMFWFCPGWLDNSRETSRHFPEPISISHFVSYPIISPF